LEVWSRISAWAADRVKLITPEVMVLCAVPLVDKDAGELGAIDVLEIVKTGNVGQGMAHRQLQLVTPWITNRAADDMPAGAAPADGLLAGHIAASTLAQGAWRTVAGRALLAAQTPYGALDAVTFEAAPQMSVIGYGQRGPAILSDRTTDPEVYNQANLRRLTALILRAARHRGQTAVFDPNGPLFWRDVAMSLTTLLRQLHSAGALRGLREEEGFQVLCGPETMSQADIDAGRAIAEITFAPANSIEFIEISLIAAEGSFTQRGIAR
jgi:phage tail sheath protein FI